MSIHRSIAAFQSSGEGEHHRYRSWGHCYGYFRQARRNGLASDRDQAALQLAFYLASWGMYRGSGFLLQHTYTVHRGVIDVIAQARFDELWDADFGATGTDSRLMPQIRELIGALRYAYKTFAATNGSDQPTDILTTKIILGTFGCLPACDRYFVAGFKSEGFSFSRLNDNFIESVLSFCQQHRRELKEEQTRIKQNCGIHYPLMKLADMYFWQIGYEEDRWRQSRRGRNE